MHVFLAPTDCGEIRAAVSVETIEKKRICCRESNLVVCPLAFSCPVSYLNFRSVHVTLHWFLGAQTSLLIKFLAVYAIQHFITGSSEPVA